MTFIEKMTEAEKEVVIMLREEKARLNTLCDTYRIRMRKSKDEEEAYWLYERMCIMEMEMNIIDSLMNPDTWTV